uniref:ZP domain-containing protein n=1 Tax=Strigamia maritima TaxID=126957 RepID=T1IUF2_STRMM
MARNRRIEMTNIINYVTPILILFLVQYAFTAKIAFEKVTGLDFRGTTYYTVRNLTLSECHGWCREENECKAVAFSFVINPLAPLQETVCQLQNETTADNPTTIPLRSVSMYYFVKLHLRPDTRNLCNRPWTFERVPNRMLTGYESAHIYTSSKEGCLSACLDENKFACRSVQYNYASLLCILSKYDRHSVGVNPDLTEVVGVDYFENLCLEGKNSCAGIRNFTEPQFGISPMEVAQYVDFNYWVDKELIAGNGAECAKACQGEREFLCRSYLYKEPEPNQVPNCLLYHIDHISFPDGPGTYAANVPIPLIDNGQDFGTYYEMTCNTANSRIPPLVREPSTTTQNAASLAGISDSESSDASDCDRFGFCYDVSVECKDTSIDVLVKATRPFNGRVYALGRSETCNKVIKDNDNFNLELSMNGQDCNTQAVGGVFTNTIVIQHHSVVITKADKLYKVRCTYDIGARNVTFGVMSIGDPQTINVTAAPEAPPPHIVIMGMDGREASAVRIGDHLTFRIEIPDETPYGIFARSCYAMAKDSKSTFQIIDDRGCPVDDAIFPRFVQDGTALQSDYEAFRFTESYGVIFQCNVKYCLGPCEPVDCVNGNGRQNEQSWGRKRRAARKALDWQGHDLLDDGSDVTLSQELLVLDMEDLVEDEQQQALSNKNRSGAGAIRVEDNVILVESCPTKTSVMALSVTCALLVLVDLCVVFVVFLRKWSEKNDKVLRM